MADRIERRDPRQYDDMLERVASSAAQKAVAEGVPPAVAATLRGLGIDTADPLKMQRQMAYLADAAARSADPESQRDREWLHTQRVRCEKVYDSATTAGVKIAVGGVGTLLLLGAVAWLKGAL